MQPFFGLVGSVLYGADETVAALVAGRIFGDDQAFGQRDANGVLPYCALGVVRGDVLVGGVVLTWVRHPHVMEMSCAFDRADWFRPSTLRHLFGYPFIQAGAVNVVSTIRRKASKTRTLAKRLGFREVGIVHKGYDGKDDGVIYEMPRSDCRWLKGLTNG